MLNAPETPFLLKPRGRATLAAKLLEPKATDKVLNVGCFNGAFEYFHLAGKVAAFYGIDVNREAISLANQWSRSAARPEGHFLIAPSESIPFPDNHFDKVLCLDTFEHVFDEMKTVHEIARVLKPGGVLILSVPHDFLNFLDHDNLTRGVRNFVRKYIRKKPLLDHPKHRHYSVENLRKFFSQFEFEYIHKSGTPVFWILTFVYCSMGLPQSIVQRLARWTGVLEDWDYETALPTGFNIMVRMIKR